ncbi:MAG TPA: DEAD/DEAH box helicase family protein [Halobacteria archaeon]|nr:DEAD/DEAH box helicase family protein [Halobacteria archaeon]
MILTDENILIKTIIQHLSYDPVLFFYNYLYPTDYRYSKKPIKAYLHQIDLLSRLQLIRPVRALIGDEIGLGKTIEAAAILRYLDVRKEINRVLILSPKILINQWKSELRRAGVKYRDIKEIVRSNIRSLERESFSDHYYIASIDLVKREERKTIVNKADWDAIVVDEVHNAGYNTQRWQLIKDLTCSEEGRKRHVIFLSATPHRGNALDYLYRLYLLDPYLSNEKIKKKELDNRDFYRLTHGSILYRRTKESVNEIEGEKIFTNCNFYAVAVQPTKEEMEFSHILVSFLRDKIESIYEAYPSPAALLAVLVRKRASSSPVAAIKTFTHILEGLSAKAPRDIITMTGTGYDEEEIESILGLDYGGIDEIDKDLDEVVEKLVKKCSNILDKSDETTIKNLIDLANIIKVNDSKLDAIIAVVNQYLDQGKKVIIFTEYKDTLEYLKSRFEKEYEEGFFETISGEDKHRFEEVKEKFEGERCNLLIATDVASEGLNLQVANIVINYEAPWSPVKLEQRMGRVWRLGQKDDVNIYTTFMATDADVDIMQNLYGKLISMRDALDEIRPLLGEKVQIAYRATATASEGLWKTKGIEFTEVDVDGKKEKINEFTLILSSLRGNLSQYIEKLLFILSSMNEEFSIKSIYPYADPGEIKEHLTNRLSATSTKEYEEYSKRLCRIICEKCGVEARRQEICNSDNPQKIWKLIRGELEGMDGILTTNIFFSPAIDPDNTHYLFNVVVKHDGRSVFEELILYEKSRKKIIYGSDLLKYLVELFSKPLVSLPSTKDTSSSFDIELGDEAKIKRMCGERYRGSIDKVMDYLKDAAAKGYREDVQSYKYDIELNKLATFIGMENQPEDIPEEIKKKIENAAMDLVMEIERREERKPDDGPAKRQEPYDIYSYDPKTGEERFIEVKGHAGVQIFGELSEREFKFGEEKGEQTFLELVNAIYEEKNISPYFAYSITSAYLEKLRKDGWIKKENDQYNLV